MPYNIRRSGKQFQVVGDTGKVHGTHPSRDDAMKQMRALYANVPDARGPKKAKKAKRKVWVPR